MSIGNLTSSYGFSTKVYTGSTISDRFTATASNQQRIDFLTKGGAEAHLNSFTIEADSADLYFSIITPGMKSNYDFSNDPVFFVPANEKMSFSGLDVIGIKFSNATGARYFIQGMGF